MGQVKIKAVPHDEEYLFAKKVWFKTRSLIGLYNSQRIKLVVTNKALYIKIANVLIDLTGVGRMRIDEIKKAIMYRNRRTNKVYNISFEDPFSLFWFTMTEEDCEKVMGIVLSINPGIKVEEQ